MSDEWTEEGKIIMGGAHRRIFRYCLGQRCVIEQESGFAD